MLTLAFLATPGSLGASTATLGAHLAITLTPDRESVIYSDRPHPYATRSSFAIAPRAAYRQARNPDAVALYDVSDTVRPRSPDEVLALSKTLGPQTIWLPIVARAPQSRHFLHRFPVRPVLPLRTDPVPADDLGRHLPPLDDLSRQVLEEGVETLGYTPVAGIRRWTQAWLDILAPILNNASLLRSNTP